MTYSTARISSTHPPFALAPLCETIAEAPLIFVVDDEWSIRRFLCTILQRTTNARIVEASSPQEALALARSIGRPVDLLISDIDMHAGKNGLELALELASRGAGAKILLMSGGDHPQMSIPAAWRFLAKPFPIAVFLDCVNELCLGLQNQAHNTP